MIPIDLLDEVIAETKVLFSDYKAKNVNGDLVPLNIYPQSLPAKKSEDDDDHFPYLIARLVDGDDEGELEANTCKVRFIAGTFDDDANGQGFRDVCNIIDILYQHFFKKRVLAKKYRIEFPFSWSLTDEDFYPFNFGGMETNWVVGKVSMLDDDLT
jgi:hypothetical protein